MGTFAHVGLGANLGNPRSTLRTAVDEISRLPFTDLLATSPIYRTEPLQAQGPDFFNAVVRLSTELEPLDLLSALQSIELKHGRERPYRNAPRILDLDLLLYGEVMIETQALTLPHPRLHERAFVLVPLFDIAPDLIVPGKGAVRALLQGSLGQRLDRVDP